MATPPEKLFANRRVTAHLAGDSVIIPVVGGAVSRPAPEPAWTIEGRGGYVVVTQSQLAEAEGQLTFFEERKPRFTNRMDQIDKAFAGFHVDNPEVWKMFLQFTHQVIRSGYEHYSADAIVHRIRWHVNIDIQRDTEFKINNNFVTCYARMFHDTYPELAGFFRTRERTSKERQPREEDDHVSKR